MAAANAASERQQGDHRPMEPTVVKAMRIMEEGMGRELEVKSVAQELGITPRHLQRLFVEHFGETPAAYLRRIRMDEAAFRLKWADEPAASLAQALGFRSRPAFIRAFERRFGVPPATFRKMQPTRARTLGKHGEAPVFFQELEPMRLLSRRYVGDIWKMRENWKDFHARLPKDLIGARNKLHIGLLHDDPRITRPEKVRYDCAIALGADHLDLERTLQMRGFQIVETYPGTYAGIRHRGHHDAIPETYDALCLKWIVPNGRVPAAAPAIEIHTVPRHRQNPHDVELTILLPVE